MLFDWVTAIIIIFTLHYFISFTLTIVQSITEAFNINIVGEHGEDIIFSKLRTEIGQTDEFRDILLKVVIYYMLIVLTVKFTIQYFKRVVYVAFLTMIAPLIGLTYPLDKIKDEQAQAFSMWLKEFLFNALIQPFQLILYYVFVGTAVMSEFAVNNPIFALIVLSFMGPAEKMLREMFGFNKGGNLGNLEAAFGGATVMNMINKWGKAKGGKKAQEASNGGKIKMANESTPTASMPDPYASLRGSGGANSEAPEEAEPSNGGTPTPENGSRGNESNGTPTSNGHGSHENRPTQQDTGRRGSSQTLNNRNNSGEEGRRQTSPNTGTSRIFRRQKPENGPNSRNSSSGGTSPIRFTDDQTSNTNRNTNPNKQERESKIKTLWQNVSKTKRKIENIPTIRGIRNVTGGTEHVLTLAAKGTLRAAGMLTVGTIGLAAGIATGEIENAVAGAIGGMAAGNRVVKNITNRSISGTGIREMFEQGKYGEKEAKKRKTIREFKASSKYQNLLNKFPEKEKEIDKFLNAGITDSGKIKIALQNSNNFSTDNAIAYINMAKLCPSEIFEDRDKFNIYLETYGIPKSKAQEIYNSVRKFK